MAFWQVLEYNSCGADSLTRGQIDNALCNTMNKSATSLELVQCTWR